MKMKFEKLRNFNYKKQKCKNKKCRTSSGKLGKEALPKILRRFREIMRLDQRIW